MRLGVLLHLRRSDKQQSPERGALGETNERERNEYPAAVCAGADGAGVGVGDGDVVSTNRKDWRWCRGCKQWVMDFPLGVGQMCGPCWLELADRDKHRAEAKAAIEYLERDYAKSAL
jgi:hypothetical protein